ncbi:unnamed protein product [Pleuronectes platessa]|uniref:Uncharacterized protein n=1 Tax=Pleuronectes platessa TaxID=8262 RepID=A0A9N7U211_PLEPL|nr:unnamed protein product [Pleuronectes platessa]
MHLLPDDPENDTVREIPEMFPPTDTSDNDKMADDQSIHLYLDSRDSDPVQDDDEDSGKHLEQSDDYMTEEEDEEGEHQADDQSEVNPNRQAGEEYESNQSSEKPDNLLMKLLAIFLQPENVEALLDMEHTEGLIDSRHYDMWFDFMQACVTLCSSVISIKRLEDGNSCGLRGGGGVYLGTPWLSLSPLPVLWVCADG